MFQQNHMEQLLTQVKNFCYWRLTIVYKQNTLKK